MEYAFPFPVRLQSQVPQIDGLRLGTFTNIDGETFAKPAMNGFWRVDMTVVARDMQAQLALSAFTTAMAQAGATCTVPICTQFRPNNEYGRPMTGCDMAPLYTFDHVGFLAEPFGGFTLLSSVNHRDSHIEVSKPELSQLWTGHMISIGDRLYQVVNVSPIDESDTAIRVSVVPSIRGNHDAGTTVIVDQLRLKCVLESGDQIGLGTQRIKTASLSFVEAFSGDPSTSTGGGDDETCVGADTNYVAIYEAYRNA